MNGNIEKIYGLTSLQEGILFYKLLNPNSAEYILQFSVQYNDGIIDESNVYESLKLLYMKHDVLRTAFSIFDSSSKPLQIILKNKEPELNSIDLRNETDKISSMESIISSDLKRGFDLEKDSLFRVTIIRLNTYEYTLICTAHHIIVDGWCLSIILEDFMNYYFQLCSGVSCDTISKQINDDSYTQPTYSDYVEWLEKQNHKTGLEYWRQLLNDYDETASINGLENKAQDDVGFKYEYLSLPSDLYEKMKHYVSKHNASMNSLIELSWGILLQKYTGKNDVVFGRVVSGRNVPIKGIDRVVGLFLNTVPVRVITDENKRIVDLLLDTHKQIIESSQYDYCALSEIQGVSKLGMNLFDSIVIFENYYVKSNMTDTISHFMPKDKKYLHDATHYPITLSVDIGNEMEFNFQYDSNKFSKNQAEFILKHLNSVLEHIVGSSDDLLVNDLEILSCDEKLMILNDFNGTINSHCSKKMMIEYFESQVKTSPNKIAIIDGERTLTYEQLNGYANSLAKKLRIKGVKPNEFVALITTRSIEMIIAIYAVLKSGGAYVPIDPSYPLERIKYIIDDCSPKAILTNIEEFYYEDKNNLVLKLNDENCFEYDPVNLPLVNHKDDYIYCIYTSGTTGNPKGVLCRNSGVVDRISWIQKAYPLSSQDNVLFKTIYTFDPSVWEIFWWNWVGAKLIILPDDYGKDPEKIVEYIINYNVSVFIIVPSVLKLIIQHLERSSFIDNGKIRLVISIGEVLPQQNVDEFYYHFPKSKLVNTYGPTEASINVTSLLCERNGSCTIGKPIDNVNIYICNNGLLCGINIPGELCISGTGIADGYLNRPELTKEKFIENPFGHGKMYKTGDLACWLSDGNIEFFGRIDDQVKIHGMRIELGEIEKNLLKDELIDNAAVIVREDQYGEKTVSAYITSQDVVDFSSLRERLKKVLPTYMIPSYFMQIDNIPMLSNGKVAKRDLPEILINSTKEYVAPRNEKEEVVTSVFEEILNVKPIGIYDNFFELGGDSIKAIRIISKLREKGFEINVADIMQSNNVESVSKSIKYVASIDTNNYEFIIEPFDKLIPSPTQKYLCNNNFCMVFGAIIKFDEFISAFDLKKIINMIYDKYGFLNTKFENECFFKTNSYFGFINVNEDNDQEIFEKLIERISINEGSLFQIAVSNDKNIDRAWLCIPQMVCDIYTFKRIINDIYECYINNNICSVIDKRKSVLMIDWEQWKKSYNVTDSYWTNYIQRISEHNSLVSLHKKTYQVKSCEIRKFDLDKLESIKTAATKFNANIYDLIIVALCKTINELFMKNETTISILSDFRKNIDDNIKNDVVGSLLSWYPVLIEYQEDLYSMIIQTKELLHSIPDAGLGESAFVNCDNCNLITDIWFEYHDFTFSFNNVHTDIYMFPYKNINSPVSIDVYETSDELIFSVYISEDVSNIISAELFLNLYFEVLDCVIEFCENQITEIYTLSDFELQDERLSQDKLEYILEEFE